MTNQPTFHKNYFKAIHQALLFHYLILPQLDPVRDRKHSHYSDHWFSNNNPRLNSATPDALLRSGLFCNPPPYQATGAELIQLALTLARHTTEAAAWEFYSSQSNSNFVLAMDSCDYYILATQPHNSPIVNVWTCTTNTIWRHNFWRIVGTNWRNQCE